MIHRYRQWEEKEVQKQKDRRPFLPLYCQDAAHGGGGGGCGRLFNHSCGWAVGGGRCGGDSQADGHAIFCISWVTTKGTSSPRYRKKQLKVKFLIMR